MPMPLSLIIDDGSPVNPMYWLVPSEEHEQMIPNSLLRDFADVCDEYGATGKFSIMPMPSGLGRLDRKLSYVPQRHLEGFLKIARERIAPRWDITIELLTHQMTVDIRTGRLRHEYEDGFVRNATVAEMTDYMSFGLRILKNVGLPANGVTSPWATGRDNEKRYAEAIARSLHRVHRRKFAWYFLHCLTHQREPRWPWVAWRSRRDGLVCVTVPANAHDPFWPTAAAGSTREARRLAMDGVDQMLTRDGRRGRVREVLEKGCPVVLLTHWQSLFSNGRAAGLWGLERLLARIEKQLGSELQWMRCSDLARLSLKRGRPGSRK